MIQNTPSNAPTLVGRSSSHFTRVTRMFAAELGVTYSFRVVKDILSLDPADYGDNPALKLPILQTARGSWFGALNICRELSRLSGERRRIVWPEELDSPVTVNAQELVLHGMSTVVNLLMNKHGGGPETNAHLEKSRRSVLNSLAWLEAQAPSAIAALPKERDLSVLEVTLFCFVKFLEFRGVVPVAPYPALIEFAEGFGRQVRRRLEPLLVEQILHSRLVQRRPDRLVQLGDNPSRRPAGTTIPKNTLKS